MNRRPQVALALTLVYLVWGSTYLFIRWMVQELPPLCAGGLRFVIAGAVFFAAGWATGDRRVTRGQVLQLAGVGALFIGVSNGLVGLASRVVPSSLTALILAVMPLWLTTFDALRPGGRRPPLQAMVGLGAGFAGTALLVWRPSSGAVPAWGVALEVTAAMVWAAGSLLARGVSRPANWMLTAGIEMFFGGLLQTSLGVLRGEVPALLAATPSTRAVLSFVYLVAIGAWVGYGAFSWLIRNASPAVASTYAYVNPLVAVVLGATVAGEPIGWRTVVAGAVIVGSVSLVTTARARP